MKLLTKEVEKRFKKFRYGAQEDAWLDSEIAVKFLEPHSQCVWLITEAEKLDSEWLLYGFYSKGDGYKFDAFWLKELESIKGIKIDTHLEDHTKVSDLISEDDLLSTNYF